MDGNITNGNRSSPPRRRRQQLCKLNIRVFGHMHSKCLPLRPRLRLKVILPQPSGAQLPFSGNVSRTHRGLCHDSTGMVLQSSPLSVYFTRFFFLHGRGLQEKRHFPDNRKIGEENANNEQSQRAQNGVCRK